MNLIHKAREVLETRGFTKYTQENGQGQVCIAGALSRAVTGHAFSNSFDFGASPEWSLINKVAFEMFPRRTTCSWHAAVDVNNHSHTTQEDMLAVLDKAAMRFDEETALS